MRMIRFIAAGSAGFFLYYILAIMLNAYMNQGVITSSIVAVLVSIFPTYLLQKTFTFRYTGPNSRPLKMYILNQALTLAIIGGSSAVLEHSEISDELGLLVAGLLGVSTSYLAQSRIVFLASN